MNYIRDYALDLLNGRLKDYVENVSTEQVEISYNNFRSISIAIKNVLLKPQVSWLFSLIVVTSTLDFDNQIYATALLFIFVTFVRRNH